MLEDNEIKENMKKVQQMIKEAPGNKGGAEIIINYYEKGWRK